MIEEESDKEINSASSSHYRSLVAYKEGRVVHRDGRPPYLEKMELQTLKLRILIETAKNHTLQLREVANIVFFFRA
jgi:hypothetical protein